MPALVACLLAIGALPACGGQTEAKRTFLPDTAPGTLVTTTVPATSTIALSTTTARPTTTSAAVTTSVARTAAPSTTSALPAACASAAAVRPNPAPARGTETVTYDFGLTTVALAAFGTVDQANHNLFDTPDAMAKFLIVDDPATLVRDLANDHFQRGARAEWKVGTGYSHALVLTFSTPDQTSLFFAQHVSMICNTTQTMRAVADLPNGVSYLRNGTGRATFVIGSTEVNVTVCGCSPDPQRVAETWAIAIDEQLTNR